MIPKALTTLKKRLSPHLGLSNSRLETMCFLIMGIVNARTVNLSHLACEFPTDSKVESTYRRLQRFFSMLTLARIGLPPCLSK